MSSKNIVKALATLAALHALSGFELIHKAFVDGTTCLYAVCRGKTVRLVGFEKARFFLVQFGGAHA